jgi:3-phosphoshikimate 1-carboxyvinyltransferase
VRRAGRWRNRHYRSSELRLKESDRIAAVVANLRLIGAEADELPDGAGFKGPIVHRGRSSRTATTGSPGAAILSARAGTIDVDDRDCVGVSYPGFWDDLARAHSA